MNSLSFFQLVFFIAFIINTTLAITFGTVFAIEKKPQLKTNAMIYNVYISSAVWSLGCGLMSVSTDYFFIHLWRYIGILGCFLFMITVQRVICAISEIPDKYQRFFNIIASTGILVWLLHISTQQTVFVETAVGVTFYLKPGLVTILYALYFTVVSFNILAVTLYIIKRHKLARMRASAKSFLYVETLIFIGAILDMFLPIFQIPAIPGSAITQFWGAFVFWFVVHQMYKSQITVSNMSEYIYYSLAIPVLVFDADHKVQIINEASAKYFNVADNPDALKDSQLKELFDTDESIFNFPGINYKERAVCYASSANCEIEISKIIDNFEDVIGYIAIINDLTDHEMVIKKLEQAKLAADSANLSKSMFLANMSHEIRTPMNAILGFSDIALSEKIDNTSREYFTNIKQAGESLLSIINDILSISKIELGKQDLNLVNYQPGRLLNDVKLIIEVQARAKHLDFVVDVDKNLPATLNGDPDKIREILINLLNNSVKYTETGRIRLEVNVLGSNETQTVLQFKVFDTGIGIKEEELPIIFDKFQRLENNFSSTTEGTGLGLAITKGLIDLMKGQIKVESIYGVGTTFTVEIPQTTVDATPYSPTQEEPAAQEVVIEDLSHVKVLAVDDNRANQKVIGAFLKKFNLDYDIAGSGPESIELCKENQYKMILMDQMMPGMDGVTAMQEIRKLPGYTEGTTTRFVALTANVVEGAKEELLSSGFDLFVGKPINFRGFARMLSEELGTEMPEES